MGRSQWEGLNVSQETLLLTESEDHSEGSSVPASSRCGLASLLDNDASEIERRTSCKSAVFSSSSKDEDMCSRESEQPCSPTSVLDPPDWASVPGLEASQLRALMSVATKGILWKHPVRTETAFYTLHHGGDVEADGNCLFTALQCQLQMPGGSEEIRKTSVRQFIEDYHSGVLPKESTDQLIKNLYTPDLTSGWGVHIVQEVKMLLKKDGREALSAALEELIQCGMSRELAAEVVYKERCTAVNDGESWASYMSVSGSPSDEHDIISLQYTEEGLLTIDENIQGRAAAFGDDIAIESLATECQREIFVLQAHGSDGMMVDDSDDNDTTNNDDTSASCLFFLPHAPRGSTAVAHPPLFLFMKGTGWCGAGGDHYEPITALPRPASQSGVKAAVVL
eukprot:jgi/Mesen1/7031/ME000366S06235